MRLRPRPVLAAALAATLAVGCVGTTSDPGPVPPGDEQSDADGTAADPPGDGQVPPLHPSVDGYPEARVELSGAADAEVLHVKLADTPDHRQHGLMEVEELPDGTGMLFVFEEERTGGFWMKNTLVPLDIAYVGPDGDIRSILAMEPCTADPCEVYDPGVSYQSALEVPQGWFARVGIEVGDELTWQATGPGTDG